MNEQRTLRLAACAILMLLSGAAHAEILIATAGPLTGQIAGSGEQQQQGAKLAVEDINAGGGVLGQPIRVIIVDDACDPEQAVAVAHQLARQGVSLVDGHICSGASIPASKVYEKARIVMISPSSTNPKLTDEGGANVFRVIGRDDQQGRIAGDYLAEHWGDKKIAILHDGQAYGQGLAEETKKQLNGRGVREAIYQAYAPGQHDYSPLIVEMRAMGIDVFYVGGYVTEAGLMLRQAHDQGYKIQLISGDSLAIDEFWLLTGPAGEGALFTFGPDPRRNPDAAAVVAKFRAANYEPEGITLYSYAVVQVWAQAVERAGSLDSGAVIKSLHEHEFETVLGTVGFDEEGDITTPSFVWYVWRNGEYLLKE